MNDEPQPPGSICPLHGGEDIDIKDGKGYCPTCDVHFEMRVQIEVTRWNPYDGLSLFGKIKYFIGDVTRTILHAFEQVWCVHEWELRSIDSWQEEINYNEGEEVNLTTLAKNLPPYFVCKHCNKHIEGK